MIYAKPAAIRRGGFTLVEVLAAAAILSFAVLAVISATQAARESQQRATYLAIGRNVAQSRIEELRGAAAGSVIPAKISNTEPSLPAGNKVLVQVAPYAGFGTSSLYWVSVTVTWPEGKGVRKVEYETLIGSG